MTTEPVIWSSLIWTNLPKVLTRSSLAPSILLSITSSKIPLISCFQALFAMTPSLVSLIHSVSSSISLRLSWVNLSRRLAHLLIFLSLNILLLFTRLS